MPPTNYTEGFGGIMGRAGRRAARGRNADLLLWLHMASSVNFREELDHSCLSSLPHGGEGGPALIGWASSMGDGAGGERGVKEEHL